MRSLCLSVSFAVVSLLLVFAADAGAQVETGAPGAAAGPAWISAPVAPAPAERGGALAVQQRPSTYWLTVGAGFGSRGGAGVVGGSYQFGGNLLSVRGAGTVAFFGDELWDIGALYGRAFQPGVVHLSVAAGVAAVGGTRREGSLFDPEERIPTTIGLPIEVQLFFRPTAILGVGLYGFGNINEEESFAGVAAAVQLGRLR